MILRQQVKKKVYIFNGFKFKVFQKKNISYFSAKVANSFIPMLKKTELTVKRHPLANSAGNKFITDWGAGMKTCRNNLKNRVSTFIKINQL